MPKRPASSPVPRRRKNCRGASSSEQYEPPNRFRFLPAGAALAAEYPQVRLICFGHLGDGNLHFNCFVPGVDDAVAGARVNRMVHDLVHGMRGSVSAEHGVGQAKRAEVARYKSDVELGLMRAVKRALDPHGLMNPGKVV